MFQNSCLCLIYIYMCLFQMWALLGFLTIVVWSCHNSLGCLKLMYSLSCVSIRPEVHNSHQTRALCFRLIWKKMLRDLILVALGDKRNNYILVICVTTVHVKYFFLFLVYWLYQRLLMCLKKNISRRKCFWTITHANHFSFFNYRSREGSW